MIAALSANGFVTFASGIGAFGSTSIFSANSPSRCELNVAISPAPPPAESSAPSNICGYISIAMRDTKPPREPPIVIVRAGVPNLAVNASRTVSRLSTACRNR